MTPWQRYRTVIISVLFILAGLVFLTLSAGRERSLYTTEKLTLEILAPVQKAVISTVDFLSSIGKSYIFLVDTSEENTKLRKEISDLRNDLSIFHESYLANQRLRKLLEFKERTELQLAAAEVVGLDPSSWFSTVILDKGTSDGIIRGMAVTNADGVVGRIVEVGFNYSKVLLIIDRNSAVDAMIQRSRARGILSGTPQGNCQLNYVLRNADVVVGDLVVTSGLAGTFPKGMILGKVEKIDNLNINEGMFRKLTIKPAVDFDLLEEVLVILKPNRLFSEFDFGSAN